MNFEKDILAAEKRFGELMRSELERIERMKTADEIRDFTKDDHITVGVMPGDGIGPVLMEQALRVLHELMEEGITAGKLQIRIINGMTIEDRVARMESLPAEVLNACKECDVLLKGPFITPRAGDGLPNFVSANSLLRRELQLFAAVRPVRIPERGIDWTFFRENIEGEYILGNKGIQVSEDLAVDFKICTRPGAEMISRVAFEYARRNGKHSVTVVTKANIIKLVDGNFARTVRHIGETEYPDIVVREELVDALAAKLGDPEYTKGMEVFVLPNLYGDIVTDIAAEMQGGLGTASSSNIGNKYALFEAIHGVGFFLVNNNRAAYADPCSLIRAVGEMLAHIGYPERRDLLQKALQICTVTERKVVVTTRPEDASAAEFTDYLLETLRTLRNR